ncbi:uncharacterized protein LOC119437637 [Dermacentor silvarum]|uniref:uncharacterized protein LOC119437637 n=1 Tax=Dermacentor silvarum TaxID=543639 RepID=UPI0021016E36|nr:uncharacterized protein LOC119437637 [Dermacentor silvarum]
MPKPAEPAEDPIDEAITKLPSQLALLQECGQWLSHPAFRGVSEEHQARQERAAQIFMPTTRLSSPSQRAMRPCGASWRAGEACRGPSLPDEPSNSWPIQAGWSSAAVLLLKR